MTSSRGISIVAYRKDRGLCWLNRGGTMRFLEGFVFILVQWLKAVPLLFIWVSWLGVHGVASKNQSME